MKVILSKVSLIVLMSGLLYGFGPHDSLDCLGCHSPHYAVDHKIFAVKNEKYKNPRTGKKLDSRLVARNCLGCHALEQHGGAGIRPMHLHNAHPIGIKPNPRIANVPKNLLKSGMLDCVSCHEAHPSNNNFMYLRADVGANGESMQNLCVICHSTKVDTKTAGINTKKIKVFSAMDESKGAKEFLVDKVRIENKTPKYVKPLGKLPANDIMPNYQNPPAWQYAPEIDPFKGMKPIKEKKTKKTTKKKSTTSSTTPVQIDMKY
jgi:predicted CXXCH cytochrome family protein